MIGLTEIRRRKVQFALIALVVTLISYLVLMISGLGVGLNVAAGSALKSFDADAIAYSRQGGLSVIRSEIGAETVAALTTLPGVDAAAPLGYVAAPYRLKNGTIESAAFLGFDPGLISEPRVTRGRTLTPADGRGLLADSRFLRLSGYRIGDTFDVTLRLTTERFTIVGEIDEGNFFFQPAVYILRSTWQELKYSSDQGAVRPEASIVLLQGDGLVGRESADYEVVSKTTAFANIEGVSGQQSTVRSLQVFGFLIGGMVIGVFFYVLTLQKVPQIGMLKALGASSGFVFRQVLTQVFTVAVIGIAISVPLAIVTERLLTRGASSVPVAFSTGTFVTTVIILVVTALVGALFSGRQVLKVDPIIALGQQQ
ncbi:MAG: ABC transporter permease [Dehalococcoidia bacterium]